MAGVVANKAEIEYAVMLAVLNFQTDFMKAHHSRAHVHLLDELIKVTLTRTVLIPAEDELARSAEGRALLRQFHQALFESCQSSLCKRLDDAIGLKVQKLMVDYDPLVRRTTLIIMPQAPLTLTSQLNFHLSSI